MSQQPTIQIIKMPEGDNIILETGQLAKQADAAILLKHGETRILATVVAEEPNKPSDFLPLSVDFQENYASVGSIPSNFLRTEGRLNTDEVLASRSIDRFIRSCFPEQYRNTVQLRINLLSAEEGVVSDPLAALAASSALLISPLPFFEPVSSVNVVRIGGKFYTNPSINDRINAEIDLIVGAKADRILMVEGTMSEVSDDDLLEAMAYAQDVISKQCEAQKLLLEKLSVNKKTVAPPTPSPHYNLLKEELEEDLYKISNGKYAKKQERDIAFKKLRNDYISDNTSSDDEEKIKQIKTQFKVLKKEVIRKLVLSEKKRIDGRSPSDIRQISVEVDFLPKAHGSSLFTRGETQVLTSCTLGGDSDRQFIDRATNSRKNDLLINYEFPGFATGEARSTRSSSRREIGHGNLIRSAITPLLVNSESEDDTSNYTIRLHCSVLESNGSSSMASICGSSLALMDCGMNMKKPIAGIAMGLLSNSETGENIILSDISGDEDAIGDMDFKVAGTADGITACQMDIKIGGISSDVLRKALKQAKEGRLHILEKMNNVLKEKREDLKPHAPRIYKISLHQKKVGVIIGPGGRVIQKIERETGCDITIATEGSLGEVSIFAPNKKSLEQAKSEINSLIEEPKVGKNYNGKVIAVQKYGVFVEFLPNKEGLLHVSEISKKEISFEEIAKLLPVGSKVAVNLKTIQYKTGKFSLTKALIPEPEPEPEPEAESDK